MYYYNDDEWCDKLTGVNGDTITYDESGNPLSYRDDMAFSWENGRQLATITTADSSIELSYNSSGMRTQKTVDGTETNYYYDSDNNLIGMTANGKTMLFYYDADGSVTSFKYNGNMYYYVKNLQGDIVKIINQSGVVYASYVYDAWGNIQSETGQPIVRSLNPFRYRGYVYDEETGLYYLQSRYYDPETGRFLNADTYCDTESGSPLSTNMFVYCENDPINNLDYTGEWFLTLSSYYNYYKNKYHGHTWLCWKGQYKKLKNRYKSNKKLFGNYTAYIYGQSNAPVNNLVLGPNYCKVSSNGCGLVAIYNVMKYIHKYQNFAKVILEAEMNGMLWLDGLFGINDSTIKQYFNAHNVKCKKIESLSKFKDKVHEYRISILYVRNKDLLTRHYYCVLKIGSKYYSINSNNYNISLKEFDWGKIDEQHFIRAFCIK